MVSGNKFIGIVAYFIDEHSFIFYSDNNVKSQIGQLVGLNISDDIYMLASIEKIDVNYFLTNPEEYFTTIASDNKLIELSKGTRSPKYSQRIKANFIGTYEYNKDKRLVESAFSINSYTPKVNQQVVSFDFDCIETVYGLKQNTDSYFKLGTFLYPKYSDNDLLPDVNISTDTFNSHTLISGVTGSGKSRLTALIANKLASNDGHITIIDPHDEYVNFANTTNNVKVSFFSKNEKLHEEKNNIYKRPLSLTYDYLNPKILHKLLPKLSEPQGNYIYEVFEKKDLKNDLTFINFMTSMIEDLKSECKIKDGQEVDKQFNDAYIYGDKWKQEYANKYNVDISLAYYKLIFPQIAKYISSINSGKILVIEAMIRKILELFEDEVFPIKTSAIIPSWLDIKNRRHINIINLDYDTNEDIRRFVNTIIQCFFTPQTNNRTLIVDEAHLLLNEKSDTANLLRRLLRESRKFGLSVIFITQNEDDVPEEIKSQFQNRFKFREEKDQILKYLDNQTCMCSIYKGKLNFPMRVDNVDKVTK